MRLTALCVLAASFFAVCNDVALAHENFLYTSAGDFAAATATLSRPDIAGVQVIYSWKLLEPEPGKYDFSAIEENLKVVEGLEKKLFIQIQDRFFSPSARNVPDYLMTEAKYGGGLTAQVDDAEAAQPVAVGWVAQQWNPPVRTRYQALLKALAAAFDGRVFGVNLPETSAEIDMRHDQTGFDCDAYFEAEMENLAFARAVFSKSHVVQYANFWPCEWGNDRNYMGRIFDYASKSGVGLGGPDIVPFRKGQMKNSYPFFNQYKDKLSLVAMAIQEPTLAYENPETGKPFTREEFESFADDYLGVDIIFWSVEAPWLRP